MIECEKNIDAYVDVRLKRWGAWCEKMVTGSLGYPHAAAFTKVGQPKSSEPKSIELIDFRDEEIEDTEKAFNALYKHKRGLAEIIRINYVSGGKLKDKCRKANLSLDSFKKQLAIARAWISGIMIKV